MLSVPEDTMNRELAIAGSGEFLNHALDKIASYGCLTVGHVSISREKCFVSRVKV